MSGSPPRNRGVIYKRVSTEDQKHNSSLFSQEKDLKAKMKNDHVKQVHKPIQDVESGRSFENRAGLKELIELVKHRSIDYVYVVDLDRLGRNVVETPHLMYKFWEAGVTVRDLQDEEYTFNDPVNYVIVAIKCYRSDFESQKIEQRTNRGNINAFLKGKWRGKPPFGYNKKPDRTLEINRDLEPIVKYIFETYACLHDATKTACDVNATYPEKIKKFSRESIIALLSNTIYDGIMRFCSETKLAPELRMVDHDLFEDVQKVMTANALRNKPKEDKQSGTILDVFKDIFDLDYVMRVLKQLKPVCPKCGNIMKDYGSKRYDTKGRISKDYGVIRLPNFICKNISCNHYQMSRKHYQMTIPGITELRYFNEELISCPKCRATKNYDTIKSFDGDSTVYKCRRCSTYFSFRDSDALVTKRKKLQVQEDAIKRQVLFPVTRANVK